MAFCENRMDIFILIFDQKCQEKTTPGIYIKLSAPRRNL